MISSIEANENNTIDIVSYNTIIDKAFENNDIDLTFSEQNQLNYPIKKILGTAYYMAPEIIKEEEITNAVDYWALGNTI